MLEAAIAETLARGDRHIAITGASGWIGRATLDLLDRALGPQFASRVSCYGSSGRMLDLGDGRQVAQRPLSMLSSLKARRVWLLHLAFQTKDRAETMDEAAYRAANQAIGDTVLDALARIDVEALFVASSGAATKTDDPAASHAMRLYGTMKREDEARFAAWAEASGRRVVIGRIFNITGPYINKHEAYAITSFIRDALANRPVAVRAPREVIRGYVAIRELMSLVFALLDDRPDGVVRFDSGGDAMELEDVAHIVANTLGGGPVERAIVTDPIPDRYVGDGAGYAALLERHHIQPVPIDLQVRETAHFMATTHTTTKLDAGLAAEQSIGRPNPYSAAECQGKSPSHDLHRLPYRDVRQPIGPSFGAGGMTAHDRPDLSVVIPCYNEEENAAAICAAVIAQLEPLALTFDIIFIDNDSTDSTVSIIRRICERDHRVRLIVNTRNYGQMRSPTHAVYEATGRAVIGMCADFQDPPELLPQFVARWQAGADIVLGTRQGEAHNGLVLRATRGLSYWLARNFSDYPVLPDATGFGLYDARVVDAVKKLAEPEPFLRGMLVETGYRLETIPFARAPRAAGKSKNNFAALLDFAMSTLAGSSKRLLRLPIYIGVFGALMTLVMLIGGVAAFFLGRPIAGWFIASVVQAELAMLFGFLGLLGDNIRIISERTRGTPLVLERERVNFPAD